MAEKILIMGESGTGKSTSLRNCDPAITAIVNPVGKPLPFKGSKRFTSLNGETDCNKICDFMKQQVESGKKILVIDDFQYILSVPYMNRINENGWDKWNDFGSNYFKIIDICKDLPENVTVYYLTHCETLENGITTVKLIGKLLREKITIEGLFTIVLKTGVNEGNYYFFTQNSGKDTVKSPMGMFDSYSIDNDLKYVDDKIRNYYEFDDAKSDAEIAKMDEEKTGEVEKPMKKSRRELAREKAEKEIKATLSVMEKDPREEIPFPFDEDMQADIDKAIAEAGEESREELPFGEPDVVTEEEPKRRRRRNRE